jgi:hypothetical protein
VWSTNLWLWPVRFFCFLNCKTTAFLTMWEYLEQVLQLPVFYSCWNVLTTIYMNFNMATCAGMWITFLTLLFPECKSSQWVNLMQGTYKHKLYQRKWGRQRREKVEGEGIWKDWFFPHVLSLGGPPLLPHCLADWPDPH